MQFADLESDVHIGCLVLCKYPLICLRLHTFADFVCKRLFTLRIDGHSPSHVLNFLKTGFLLVFCLELLLYLVLDLTIEIGATSKGDFHPGTAIGTLLALPLYVHGLACSLVIAVQFVQDTWNGHPLVRRFIFGRFNGVLSEWLGLFGFILVPLLVAGGTLFAGVDNWWELTTLTWFSCIFCAYIVFAIAVVGFENRACWEVTRNRYEDDDDSWSAVIKRAILLRMQHNYGGYAHTTYLAIGSIDDGVGADEHEHMIEESHRERRSLYSKFVRWKWLSTEGGLGLFAKLETPIQHYTLADVTGERPFVTANSWTLETIYCRPSSARYVAVLQGPGALTRPQLRASLVCAVLGNIMIVFLVAAILAWLGLPGFGVLAIVILVLVFGMYPSIKSSIRLLLMTKNLLLALDSNEANDANARGDIENEAAVEKEEVDHKKGEAEKDDSSPGDADTEAKVKADSGENYEVINVEQPETAQERGFVLHGEESEGIYQVWETYRITAVTERMCWIIFGLEFALLFLWPLVALYIIGNYATATLFFFIALFSGLRTYLNAAIVLEETGTLDLVDGAKGTRAHWHNQSRLSTIVTKITRSPARGVWMNVLCTFLVTFLLLFGVAISQEGDTSNTSVFTYAPDFEYLQEDASLMYPTCTIGKGLEALGNGTTDMADYAFLAQLAYRQPVLTQNELNQWFGNDTAIDSQDFVDEYRNSTDGFLSAVSYKLVVFPNSNNTAMVCVRGTTNAWDALTDAQLWAAAGIFQMLRLILPIGAMWTPILHRMVDAVSWLASESINKVAFYRETTKFVEFLKSQPELFPTVQITGHSLGGGLSIITGAQTGVAAVALSGPNALLSRTSFDPPITEEALDKHTFNIIPDRDIVPRFDDKAKLNQAIRCTAPFNDFIGCHDGRRSVCEIIFTCGTGSRPALCDCVTEFGYPEPTPREGVTTTFAEACASLIDAQN